MTRFWPTRRWPRLLLWLAALALLAGVLPHVSLAEVWHTLSRLGLGALLLLAAANGLVLVLLTGRWWLLLRGWGYALPFLPSVGYRLAAFGVSYFTPGPQFGGEPLQVYLPHRHHRVPTDVALAAVTLDKLLELLANFSFLVGGILLIGQQQLFPEWANRSLTIVAVGLLALPLAVLALLLRGRSPLSGPIEWVGWRWGSRLSELVRRSEAHIAGIYHQQPGHLALALVVSGISWLALVAEYMAMVWVLGANLSLTQALVALTVARLAFLLPLPGGLGALEASQVLAMSALGFEPALGLSISLLIRARDVLLGGLGLWWGGLKS